MRKSTFCLMIAVLTLAPLSQAKAVCAYRGELYAKTTIAQEVADSRWVMRARVIGQTDSWRDPRRERDTPWTTYRIEVLEAFKGSPPPTMTVFTWRDSGGFYLEPDDASPSDPGTEYLLFLNPTTQFVEAPPEAAGTAMINYSCGQSKLWTLLAREDRRVLADARQAQRR